jgi:hypothetical protein
LVRLLRQGKVRPRRAGLQSAERMASEDGLRSQLVNQASVPAQALNDQTIAVETDDDRARASDVLAVDRPLGFR